MRYLRRFSALLAVLLLLASPALAHSGRTDSQGGHYNRSTGEYHFHHGYPAHQHPNGVCPYSTSADTSTTTSTKSSTKSSTKTGSKSSTKTSAKDDSSSNSKSGGSPDADTILSLASVGGAAALFVGRRIAHRKHSS